MPRFLSQILEKLRSKDALPRLKQQIVGVAEDFWHDGGEDAVVLLSGLIDKKGLSIESDAKINPFNHDVAKKGPDLEQKAAPSLEVRAPVIWHAEAGEISEKMWGDGCVTPGDIEMTVALITPLALNKDMSVLDISAGLGSRLQKATTEFGVYITGLEPDPQIAARGMELAIRKGKGKHVSIATYDPASFSLAKKYDCIIARETFYRVEDKNKFFTSLAGCAKPKAQITFTDYIINPEDRDKPAIKAWQAFETGAAPLSLVEMAEGWAKAGFTIRVHDDQTDYYKKEVIAGLKRLAVFLASGIKPDKETKAAILKRVQTWTHRAAAMDQGMKFYRFYGTKH